MRVARSQTFASVETAPGGGVEHVSSSSDIRGALVAPAFPAAGRLNRIEKSTPTNVIAITIHMMGEITTR
jgi:hypothetical protein